MPAKPSRKRLCALVLFAATVGSAASISAQTASAAPSIASADLQFSREAAAAGVAEVQFGELALKKSSNDRVKNLARHIVDDHRKADAELASLGNQKQIALPTEPSADASKAYTKLRKESGRAFDQAWTKMMIKDHQDAIKLFTAEASKGKDSDLRKFAATALPTLQSHLDSAEQIAAVPKARDKAMDSTMKAMSTADLKPPAAASTAAAPPANIPSQIPAAAAVPATVSNSPTTPSAPSGQKH